MKSFKFLHLLFLPIICLLFSCGSGDDDDDNTSSFDRAAMLENLGEQVIIPSYATLASAANTLDTATQSFISSPDSAGLITLRGYFREAYLAWQRVAFYDFGPGNGLFLKNALNSYPTDTSLINTNISSGDYNLDQIKNNPAKGFPAVEYLLYGYQDSVSTIVQAFVSSTDRSTYLTDLTEEINTKTETANTEWASHIADFKSKDGNDVGSSLVDFTNAFIMYLETGFRNQKYKFPLGISVNTPSLPEAFYSGESNLYALESIKAMKDFYLGKGENDGLGLYDNLVEINAQDGELADDITAQFDAMITSIEALGDPLFDFINTNETDVQNVYTQSQKLIPLFKVDMTSVLGITITYQDNDGD